MLLKAIFCLQPKAILYASKKKKKKNSRFTGDLLPTEAGSTSKLLLLPHMTAPTAGHLHCPSPYKTGGVKTGAIFCLRKSKRQ